MERLLGLFSGRGEDTRKCFIGHLYEELEENGISTIIDSRKLEKGEDIEKLFEYIERSKIFVLVLSKCFAESKWCLKEVTKSVECGKEIMPALAWKLPVLEIAVDIYAAVAKSLAERKKGNQLTEFLRNIKGTIDDSDWDRKVIACVICGRLKTSFQIASRNGSTADVDYVAHQALLSNSLPVVDMCRQWFDRNL
ncbi:disease resistance protein Roq1-like [Nymphaea colorata]|nr:disease resistance protein Roq1-like [Nymphaea colorata]